MTVLEDILRSTRAEVQRRKRESPEAELQDRALAASGGERRRFRDVLNGPEIAVIAEFKRRSPSAGQLHEGMDVATVVSAYERGGARAISVLTEGPNFEGSLEDLRGARAACGLPILRKDFVVDSYQLYEAVLAGADAVLLIVAALNRSELTALHEQARTLGLDALVEVHERAELRVALEAGADLIGINNRDLRDFSVDVERTFELLEEVPAAGETAGVTVISESGIATPAQLARLERAGVQAVLVGESLIRSPDPEQAVKALAARSERF